MLRRYVRAQTLWTADGVAWPSLTANELLEFRNTNTLVDTTLTASRTGRCSRPRCLAPSCFGLRSASWTSSSAASSTPAMPTRCKRTAASTSQPPDATAPALARRHPRRCLFSHPVGEAGKTLEDTFERGGFIQSDLIVRGHAIGASVLGNPDSSGVSLLATWPFTGNKHAADERWYLSFPCGRKKGHILTNAGAAEGELEVSGFEKIWIWAAFQNPSSQSLASPWQTPACGSTP